MSLKTELTIFIVTFGPISIIDSSIESGFLISSNFNLLSKKPF